MKKKSGLADSPFFQQPSPPPATEQPPAREAKDKPTRTTERANERTGERPNGMHNRTTERANDRTAGSKRTTKRHSFEIFTDQLTSLKELQARSILTGQEKSLSAMVREALDHYFDDHN